LSFEIWIYHCAKLTVVVVAVDSPVAGVLVAVVSEAAAGVEVATDSSDMVVVVGVAATALPHSPGTETNVPPTSTRTQ
jgi:hypothetical protein